MEYAEAINLLTSKGMFRIDLGLDRIALALEKLGNPQDSLKCIHVAGTNGKGSVCAYLQAILMAEGKRTGFFTSPHLVSVNERIQVDHTQIDNETFLRVFLQVLEVVRQMEEEGIAHPSYFEFLLGMGMKAFAGTDVEYIILETGLGGRLDATNSIPQPALSIITSISLDHTAILGDTIEEIAADTIQKVKAIKKLLEDTVEKVKTEAPKIYSKELIETLFENPYCKVEFIVKSLGVERKAASRYLHQLEDIGILKCMKVGKDNLFINIGLMDLLKE